MHGTRILDLTRVLAGPWAVQHLADQGADVIKVEPPGGDETRQFGPVIDGHSTYFLAANRNKRAITLDLKTEGGRAVLERLLDGCDVLVENFRPGVLERLGWSWERLAAQHPRLIVVAIHAFGEGVPGWSDRPGYDLLLQHMGGATAMTGFPGSPPTKHANSNADLIAGLYAVQAILQGLLHREKTGVGQKIVVNMMQAQATCLAYHATRWTVTGEVGQQRGNSHFGIVPYDVYECSDGWFVIACANDKTWARLREALELPNHPEWLRNADRVADRQRLTAAIGETLAGMTTAQADQLMHSAGVPAGPVLSADQTLSHPAVERIEVDHAAFGPITLTGPAIRTATTRAAHSAPPLLGQHHHEILTSLGFGEAEIASLRDSGALG